MSQRREFKPVIERISIDGRTLNAESRHAGTIVQVRNTGEGPPWDRGDLLAVMFGIGTAPDKMLDDYVWHDMIDQEVDYKEVLQVRFSEFRTPPGTRQWPLFAWVTAGGKTPLKNRGAQKAGKIRTQAHYRAAFRMPSRSHFEPYRPVKLEFKVKNSGDYTFPGGERWWLRGEIERHPSSATKKHVAAMSFSKPLRWGDDEVPEDAVATVTHEFETPHVPGEWWMELTLMRGREPFEPCAGTPDVFRFRINPASLEKYAVESGRVGVISLIDRPVEAESVAPPFYVNLHNTSRVFAWNPQDHRYILYVSLGETAQHKNEYYTGAQLTENVEPGGDTRLVLRNLETPMGTGDWPVHAEFFCNDKYLVADIFASVRVQATYGGSWRVSGRKLLKPNDERVPWEASITNRGRHTWPGGEGWVIRAVADDGPNGYKKVKGCFEFESPKLGRSDIRPGQSLKFRHTIDEVPELEGDWNLRLQLLDGGDPFPFDREEGEDFDFDISRAVPEADIEIRRCPDSAQIGSRFNVDVLVSNTGNKTFREDKWRVEIEVMESGSGMTDFYAESLGVFVGDEDLGDDEKTTVSVRVLFDSDMADDPKTRGEYSVQAHLLLKPDDSRPLASSNVKKLDLKDPK